MEACCRAHHIGHALAARGHEIRLVSPEHMLPYVKAEKNEDRNAEAIAEAASRPTMRFVTVKSDWQLDKQTLHPVRDRPVGDWTWLMNHFRWLIQPACNLSEWVPILAPCVSWCGSERLPRCWVCRSRRSGAGRPLAAWSLTASALIDSTTSPSSVPGTLSFLETSSAEPWPTRGYPRMTGRLTWNGRSRCSSSTARARARPARLVADLGSGMGYDRRGLRRLLYGIVASEVGRLVITHENRLLRFGAELVSAVCAARRVEVVIATRGEDTSSEDDLGEDVLEIVTAFTARLTRTRSRKGQKLLDDVRWAAAAAGAG